MAHSVCQKYTLNTPFLAKGLSPRRLFSVPVFFVAVLHYSLVLSSCELSSCENVCRYLTPQRHTAFPRTRLWVVCLFFYIFVVTQADVSVPLTKQNNKSRESGPSHCIEFRPSCLLKPGFSGCLAPRHRNVAKRGRMAKEGAPSRAKLPWCLTLVESCYSRAPPKIRKRKT